MTELFYPSSLSKRPIFVFWHTWTASGHLHEHRYQSIVVRQLQSLYASRLIDVAKNIYVSAPTAGANILKAQLPSKESINLSIYETNQHEAYTLAWLKDLVDAGTIPRGAFILYFHTRGSSRVEQDQIQQCSDDWTRMLEYFCIERWRFAVESLESHYTCGCEMWSHNDSSNQRIAFEGTREFWHYSGNFWWANSNYILELLPSPTLYHSGNFNTDRARAEDWVLSSVGRLTSPTEHKVLHYTGEKYKQGAIHSYVHRYPSTNYIGGKETPRIDVSGKL